ncbi:hypothetical protein HBE96_09090 [Clostridium sp. P21]|uniref:Uncharacterized protein n=1 Tax=Clostridium muellerianum TaxID=2716538 RepID=A0A7Y0HNN7_9CLOT|nr:hypothetical protein [Clostridium muellerianum]NMM62852.1 hypothetical protein [Clostridium muellerianum]
MKNNKKETSLKKENNLSKNKYEYKLIYYVICYGIGYVISLCVTGVPNLMYLIPIKLDAIFISVMIGTFCNIYHYNIPGDRGRHYMFRPLMIGILLIFIILIITKVLLLFGVIVTPDPFGGMLGMNDKYQTKLF